MISQPYRGPLSFVMVRDPACVTTLAQLTEIGAAIEAQLNAELRAAWHAQLPAQPDRVFTFDNGSQPLNLPIGAPAQTVFCRLDAEAPATASEGALAEHGNEPGGPTIGVYEDLLARFGIAPQTPTLLDAVAAGWDHEAIEASLDLQCTRTIKLPDGRTAALEACDQVQDTTYRSSGGVCLSNFNTPANYGIGSTAAPYDHLGLLTSAFGLCAGGYEQVLEAWGWNLIQTDERMRVSNGGLAHRIAPPPGMAAYRAELAQRGLGRHAYRQRAHVRGKLTAARQALELASLAHGATTGHADLGMRVRACDGLYVAAQAYANAKATFGALVGSYAPTPLAGASGVG